jgi:MbtH protein
MTSLLDEVDGTFVVLVNAEGQHSLWPEQIAVPAGWTVMHAADTRQNCLGYIKENWTDMRPESLKRSMTTH